MSTSRQTGALPVRTLAVGYPGGAVLERHTHDWGQLVYAFEGVMRVETDHGIWVVPSHRAVWIPPGTGHSIAMSGWVSMRTLYLDPGLDCDLPERCCVIEVSPLLRELILHVVAGGPLSLDVPEQRRTIEFLVDRLRVLPVVPLELPMPLDPRARRLAQRIQRDPGSTASLDGLAREAGGSRRTLERLFARETGISLGRWRQQARLLHAMNLLAQGEPVTGIALDVGYDSPSAFISAFADAFGTTPGRYYRERGGAEAIA